MFSHLYFGFLGLLVMGNIMCRRMDPAVEEIDPDPNLCPLKVVRRHEANSRILFVEVFVDNCRLIDHAAVIDQHRHFGVRVELKEILGFVFEVHFDEFVGGPFLCQDNPCPVSIGSAMGRVEFHWMVLLVPVYLPP